MTVDLRSRTLLNICCLLPMLLTACEEPAPRLYQGYVEGEYVQVAAPLAGRLETLAVARGSSVEAGAPLFTLERDQERAAVEAAQQDVERLASRLADLNKGQRPSEIEALEARLARTRAALELSLQEFARREALFADRLIAREELDQARTALQRDRAAVGELEAELTTARLGARSDLVAAARADVAAARARLRQAEWAFDQKELAAGEEALVFDTLFEPGEFVAAGYPVVSLLPPDNLKIRFFVPEPLLGRLRLGQPLRVGTDGGDPFTATVSYISPEVEYTPPVIFSRETRAKLVFMVEARPAAEAVSRLHPGQPVDVRLEGGDE